MPTPANRQLLFGILALQNGLITREALIAGINAWTQDKSRSMGDLLVAAGAMTPAAVALLEPLVAHHVEVHGGDAQQSLAALSSVGSELRRELSVIADGDIHASLAAVGAARADSTLDYPADSSARYRILRPHARGGLGEVFVAEDTEVHRQVALKEIQQRYADDPHSRGRFLLEAEITGRLEHPGIVPVYGLGTYADGRPYYAMRFIKGDNLAEAIKRFHDPVSPTRERGETEPSLARRANYDSLDFRRLLRRFLDVCNAVAYAHSRGVLHRDLKPGNVMLGEFGETLLVDWGLAKVVGRPDSTNGDSTIRPTSGSSIVETMAGSAVGTPAFMSPEQAEGKLDELGPATDVYSLGATLYMLLTGRPSVEKGEPAEMLEKVRRGDIPAPRAVQPGVPKALEAVCRNAMAPHIADRYGTVHSLIADLENWLAGDRVSALPETFAGRYARWCRKQPAMAIITFLCATLIMLNLCLGIFWVMYQQFTVASRMVDAVLRAPLLYATATLALGMGFTQPFGVMSYLLALPRQHGRAIVTAVVVGGVLAPMVSVGIIIAIASGKWPGSQWSQWPWKSCMLPIGIAAGILGTALGHLIANMLNASRSQKAGILLLSFIGCGLTAAAEFCFFPLPAADQPDALIGMNNLAASYAALGRHNESLAWHEMMLKLLKAKLGPDHPDTLRTMNNIAANYAALGRHNESLAWHEETLKLRKAKLGPDHADTLRTMNNIAANYAALGRLSDALATLEETYKVCRAKLVPDHPDTLISMNNLAAGYSGVGRHRDALALNEETLRLRKARLGPNHPQTLDSMNNLATSYLTFGRHAEALTLMEETLRLRKAKLGHDHPETLGSMIRLTMSYDEVGRHGEGVALREETLKLMRAKFGPSHPGTLASMNNLAFGYRVSGRHAEALELSEESLALAKSSVGPDHPTTLMCMHDLSESIAALGRYQDALKLKEETLGLQMEKLGPSHPATANSMYGIAYVHALMMAGAEEPEKQALLAVDWLKRAVAAGYSNVEHIKKDKDLDALRNRDDFKKLLADLEAKAAAGKPAGKESPPKPAGKAP